MSTVKVEPIESLAEFKEKINGDKPVLIDFWATWCGPCRVISPIFEQFAQRTPDILFLKVDVDEQQEIAQEVGIRAMPTFQLYKNGEKAGESVGAVATSLEALVVTGLNLKDPNASSSSSDPAADSSAA